MHKKGITEEVAKKRSRRTVKHQRGIAGLDLATIVAKRNQTVAVRTQQRMAAIAKAKNEKKEKEVKKAKVSFGVVLCLSAVLNGFVAQPTRAPVASAPKVSKQQMKGGKGGR
jgi:large subunit ribosomal protein L24e